MGNECTIEADCGGSTRAWKASGEKTLLDDDCDCFCNAGYDGSRCQYELCMLDDDCGGSIAAISVSGRKPNCKCECRKGFIGDRCRTASRSLLPSETFTAGMTFTAGLTFTRTVAATETLVVRTRTPTDTATNPTLTLPLTEGTVTRTHTMLTTASGTLTRLATRTATNSYGTVSRTESVALTATRPSPTLSASPPTASASPSMVTQPSPSPSLSLSFSLTATISSSASPSSSPSQSAPSPSMTLTCRELDDLNVNDTCAVLRPLSLVPMASLGYAVPTNGLPLATSDPSASSTDDDNGYVPGEVAWMLAEQIEQAQRNATNHGDAGPAAAGAGGGSAPPVSFTSAPSDSNSSSSGGSSSSSAQPAAVSYAIPYPNVPSASPAALARRPCTTLVVPYSVWGGRQGALHSYGIAAVDGRVPMKPVPPPPDLAKGSAPVAFTSLRMAGGGGGGGGSSPLAIVTVTYEGPNTLNEVRYRFGCNQWARCPIAMPSVFEVQLEESERLFPAAVADAIDVVSSVASIASIGMMVPSMVVQLGTVGSLKSMSRCTAAALDEPDEEDDYNGGVVNPFGWRIGRNRRQDSIDAAAAAALAANISLDTSSLGVRVGNETVIEDPVAAGDGVPNFQFVRGALAMAYVYVVLFGAAMALYGALVETVARTLGVGSSADPDATTFSGDDGEKAKQQRRRRRRARRKARQSSEGLSFCSSFIDWPSVIGFLRCVFANFPSVLLAGNAFAADGGIAAATTLGLYSYATSGRGDRSDGDGSTPSDAIADCVLGWLSVAVCFAYVLHILYVTLPQRMPIEAIAVEHSFSGVGGGKGKGRGRGVQHNHQHDGGADGWGSPMELLEVPLRVHDDDDDAHNDDDPLRLNLGTKNSKKSKKAMVATQQTVATSATSVNANSSGAVDDLDLDLDIELDTFPSSSSAVYTSSSHAYPSEGGGVEDPATISAATRRTAGQREEHASGGGSGSGSGGRLAAWLLFATHDWGPKRQQGPASALSVPSLLFSSSPSQQHHDDLMLLDVGPLSSSPSPPSDAAARVYMARYGCYIADLKVAWYTALEQGVGLVVALLAAADYASEAYCITRGAICAVMLGAQFAVMVLLRPVVHRWRWVLLSFVLLFQTVTAVLAAANATAQSQYVELGIDVLGACTAVLLVFASGAEAVLLVREYYMLWAEVVRRARRVLREYWARRFGGKKDPWEEEALPTSSSSSGEDEEEEMVGYGLDGPDAYLPAPPHLSSFGGSRSGGASGNNSFSLPRNLPPLAPPLIISSAHVLSDLDLIKAELLAQLRDYEERQAAEQALHSSRGGVAAQQLGDVVEHEDEEGRGGGQHLSSQPILVVPVPIADDA